MGWVVLSLSQFPWSCLKMDYFCACEEFFKNNFEYEMNVNLVSKLEITQMKSVAENTNNFLNIQCMLKECMLSKMRNSILSLWFVICL